MSKLRTRPQVRDLLRRRELFLRHKNRFRRKRMIRDEPIKKESHSQMESPVEHKMVMRNDVLKSTRKRLHRCCVPHCATYGTSDQFIPFPSSDSTSRRAWLDAIPRKNWIVCHNTLICKNHFMINENNKENIAQYDRPTLFPQPTPLDLEDKYRRIDKGMFQISSNYTLPETFGDLARVPNCDKFIFDFSTLTSKYKQELKVVLEVCKWMVEETQDRLNFYKVHVLDGCVKISTSVVIDKELKPTIALEGIIMDPLDCTRHVPILGKITHWNQLNLMLLDYGFDRKEDDKSISDIRAMLTDAV